MLYLTSETDCQEILEEYPSPVDGEYVIDPDGDGPESQMTVLVCLNISYIIIYIMIR